MFGKKVIKIQHIVVCFTALLLTTVNTFAQQISINDSFTAQELIENNLVQGCVQVSNINSTVNGSVNGFASFGYFEQSNSNFPFANGIVLSTGNVASAGNVVNTNPLNEGDTTWGTDPDLESAIGISNTLNATSIEFDFISTSSTVQFNYILASEEYYLEYPCLYSDGFAFLIKEAGTNNPYQNIAIVPGTSTPVNTSTIHDEIVGFCDAENSQYFDGYNLGDTNFNGRTTVLSASASITPNVQYSIKLIVADQTDRNFDTAVFIQGNSFTDSVDLGEDISTCDASVALDANTNNPQATYQWFINNTLLQSANSSSYTATISGTYTVEVTVPLNADTCTFSDSINLTLNSVQTGITLSSFELCDDASNDGVETFNLTTKNTEFLNNLPTAGYNISYHLSFVNASNNISPFNTITNFTNPQNIFARAEDTSTGCVYVSEFQLIVNPFPIITNPTSLEVCANDSESVFLTDKDDEITNSNPNYTVTYHYSQPDTETGDNPIASPYTPNNTTENLFVRIVDATTGCYTTTTLVLNVNDNPAISSQTQQLDACGQDDNEFEFFDLTSVIGDVLQGITNVTVTYHETIEDAQSGDSPITNPTNYQNITELFQTVYIRVVDNTTGCASITNLEIHTFLLESATQIRNFFECDDSSNDDIVDFDLLQVGIEIINNLEDVTIEFYETEADQLNQTSPIDQNTLYEVTQTPHTLYISLSSQGCSHDSEIQLIINDAFQIQTLTTQNYCDTDDDGFTTIELATFDDYVSTGIDNPIVTYYLTEADALANDNILPELHTNTINPTTLYTRVTNSESNCYDIEAIQIEVLPAPTITSPSDFVICDDDQDGFWTIDLTQKISEIVTNTNNLQFTFHTSQADAETNENEILDTTTYNTNTQMVFCRVENTITGCFAVQNIQVYVNTLPVFTTISDFNNCETDGDQVADFLLSSKDAEILNGQTGKEVLYFTNSADALSGNSPIDKDVIYNNTSNPQTIHVRVENTTDTNCFDTASFLIEVGSEPIYNAPIDLILCDDISNDGFEEFTISGVTTQVIQNSPETLNVSYYLTLEDAQNEVNSITTNTFTNTVNPQELFISVDNGTYCKGIASFELNVIQVPTISTSSALQTCDNDTDGLSTFDLTVAELEVLAIRQNNIIVSYFENEMDMEAGANVITAPENYTNTENPQTVYIQVLNTISNCYAATSIVLNVEVPPTIAENEIFPICEEATNSYNLNETISTLIGAQQNVETSFYATLNDAETSQNEISTDYNYTIGNQTLFLKANFTGSSCENIELFTLTVNTVPVANPVQDLETCDDDFDGFAFIDLSQQTSTTLGNQNPANFTVTYFLTESDSNVNNNPISNLNYHVEDGQTFYIRIENNTTNCASTTSFNTTVLRKPDVEITNQVICLDNLPLIVTAETEVSTDTYLWSTGETASDIEIDTIGDYSVTVTTQFGCVTTSNFNVSVSEAATIEFTETVDFSDPNNVTVTVNGIGDYLYQWDTNAPQESNFFGNVPIGAHTITVIDINGCNSVSREIVIIDFPQFVTPNSDGYFDTWHITGVNQLAGTIVTIYDRYGKLIKTLTHTSQGWDGTYNGNLMPANDYWFVADVVKGNIKFQAKGHFTLKL